MTDLFSMDSDFSELILKVRAFTEEQHRLSLRLAHLNTEEADHLSVSAGEPSTPGAGPFDDLIASVTTPVRPIELDVTKLPPPSRFMVRASRLDRPHRVTKRNYNYFDQLNSDLAKLGDDELAP
jgi:hypothetical protein